MKKLLVILIALLVIAGGTYYFLVKKGILPAPFSVGIVENEKIEDTPIDIQSLRSIGEWEFVSVDIEEMVDTTISKKWGSSDKLSCIYKGTLRLGLNMKETGSDWFVANGDTAIIHLPKAKLLDEKFIDESKTKVFFQDGNFAPVVMESLAKRAESRMKARALTEKNLKQVTDNAKSQVVSLVKAAGYKTIIFN